MGGRALKTVKTRRYERDEYFKIADHVLATLAFDAIDCAVVPAYASKANFGDLDVLLATSSAPSAIIDLVEKRFHPEELVHDHNCYSFPVEELQVDLIAVELELFEFSLAYYSFNDLGNLMGRVAHRMGLKYGHQGLVLPVRYNGTHELGELVVTLDVDLAFEFLGFDYGRFCDGFNDLEDIFKYVAGSRYFSKALFSIENLNHINRTRNRKRATYMAFLKWLEEMQPADRYDHGVLGEAEPVVDKEMRKAAWLVQIDAAFPEAKLIDTARMMLDGADRYKAARDKVLAVAATMGLTGPPLGNAMASLRKCLKDNKGFCAYTERAADVQIGNVLEMLSHDYDELDAEAGAFGSKYVDIALKQQSEIKSLVDLIRLVYKRERGELVTENLIEAMDKVVAAYRAPDLDL